MTVMVKAHVVEAVGKCDDQVFKFNIQLSEGTDEEQRMQIFDTIAEFSDDLDIEWVVK